MSGEGQKLSPPYYTEMMAKLETSMPRSVYKGSPPGVQTMDHGPRLNGRPAGVKSSASLNSVPLLWYEPMAPESTGKAPWKRNKVHPPWAHL